MNTKGTVGGVPHELKAFLEYVDNGIVSGKFVKELDAAVKSVKMNEKVRHDFMTLQMALLEERMEGEERSQTKNKLRIELELSLKAGEIKPFNTAGGFVRSSVKSADSSPNRLY